MGQEIPVRCGCADIIVPPGNSWTNMHLFPVKSEEMFHAALHQDTGPRGNAGRDVLECGCLVNELNINLEDREAHRPGGHPLSPVQWSSSSTRHYQTKTNTAL